MIFSKRQRWSDPRRFPLCCVMPAQQSRLTPFSCSNNRGSESPEEGQVIGSGDSEGCPGECQRGVSHSSVCPRLAQREVAIEAQGSWCPFLVAPLESQVEGSRIDPKFDKSHTRALNHQPDRAPAAPQGKRAPGEHTPCSEVGGELYQKESFHKAYFSARPPPPLSHCYFL